ncbi:DUF1828 domain-containing protein [Lactobacillus jensenii]|jgi:conserved domain protein|uniref:DUF1828 domain-containing protein n=3 Tax=Lactobacillus jensenii TaxID=109790 RepID=A0A5N1IAS7_LACJE|nr:DUF1828 domain-containing protein [Lactobacillus jensenii]EEQ69032.1 hypothetical protein LBJG_01460 [Lactobacillus jensenii 1153]ERJ43589.1 hypothetical protein N581_08845 [Lactobacillus jensenii MD IIE-70(2)]APT14875.1 hypothetical protein BUE77_05390 [Lactobacillus jensenii]EEQ24583.1 hypothetical protein LACJE0001_1609 [Lactobacillus jensenii 269-3]EEX27580.1 hypothetical protein HMPREF0527_00632 [Lactobacillus jensenii SJ-7A-US]
MNKAELLKNSYYNWLNEELTFTEQDNYVEITTPFLDSVFDNICIYAKFAKENSVELSDFGQTLFNLEGQGISIQEKNKKIWNSFKTILDDFGISIEGRSLVIITPLDKFPTAKNRILQAIMKVNDLVFMYTNKSQSSFDEIVSDYLSDNKILFTKNIQIVNTSVAASIFDFSIPFENGRSKLIKTVARPNDYNSAKIFNYDVKACLPIRSSDQFVCLFNDQKGKQVDPSTINTALEGVNTSVARAFSFSEAQENNVLDNKEL